jgi:thiosulfate/3-mercaptopyruvate sulfurtransferase
VNAVDLGSTGRFKSKNELEDVLMGELGLDKKKPVITYCQRGIRAAHTAFVLQEVAGFEDVKVYEDSMLQYLNRDDTAVEK